LLAGTDQGLDACNGWTFWHLETAQGLVSNDALRAEVRAEMRLG
jgi:modification methylase